MQNQVDTKTCSFSRTLNEESIKSIKAAVNSIAKLAKLSKNKKNKLLKYELENPSEWWDDSKGEFPADPDNSHDLFVQCFYGAIDDVFSGRVPVDPRVRIAILYAQILSQYHDIHV
jgi:hypothetical protein